VAGAIDIETGTAVGDAVTVEPVFVRPATTLSAPVRLPGVQGDGQELAVVLTFADGTSHSRPLPVTFRRNWPGSTTIRKCP
jgi:hypothetical protein